MTVAGPGNPGQTGQGENNRFLWCSDVRLPQGWASNVLFEVTGDGLICHLTADHPQATTPRGTQHFHGSAIAGIANLHSHAHQRAMAGLGEHGSGGDSFWTWREAMYRTVARIDPDQLYDVARMLYLEMLEAGYTRVGEFQYLHHDPRGKPYQNSAEMTLQCARAAADVGIGFTALPVLYGFGGFGGQPPGDAQKRFINDADGFLEIVSVLDRSLAGSQVVGIAPHSLRAVPPQLLEEVVSRQDPGRVIHIHIAEQTREIEDCLNWSKQRPVQWLLDHFQVDHRWVLIHATHMDDEETARLAKSTAVAGLCPTTEANLGDGFFNAIQYLEQGGAWGIGSDSHISISPTEEIRWLEYGQRLLMRSRNLLGRIAGDREIAVHTGASLLEQATTAGARACGYGHGQLVPGQPADLVVLDAEHPRLAGRSGDALIDSWIFSHAGNPVQDVVVGGRHRIKQNTHPDREEIRQRFNRTVKHLIT